MTVSKAVADEIRRLYFAEHSKRGTIATQLGVHFDVVVRVLGSFAPEAGSPCPDARMLEPFVPFIDETLARSPRLVATRVHDMMVERGYEGSLRTHNLARRQKWLRSEAPRPSAASTGNHPRTIDCDLYEQLHGSLDFVRREANVLLRGHSGVGKTTPAPNLGLRALERGYTVRFLTLPAALADLPKQESNGASASLPRIGRRRPRTRVVEFASAGSVEANRRRIRGRDTRADRR